MPRSPRRRIPLASVIGELTVLRTRLGFAKTSADLTPATGARTTRFCRTQLPSPTHPTRHLRPAEVLAEAFKRRSSTRCRSLTENRPATCLRAQRCRVHRTPSQRFVTIAIRPSFKGMRCGSYAGDLVETGREIFLRDEDWTGEIRLIWLRKLVLWRSERRAGGLDGSYEPAESVLTRPPLQMAKLSRMLCRGVAVRRPDAQTDPAAFSAAIRAGRSSGTQSK